jgi:chemotaxis protein CheD
MDRIVKVGMADLNVVHNPGVLTTLGLGSCVAIALYDNKQKIAGLAHIMLPCSKSIKSNENRAKFADTAVYFLIEKMEKLGADVNDITAKIAGGSQMFSFKNKNNDMLKIGERNVVATLKTLKEAGIPVVGQDTGGNYGRTVELYAETGILLIKTIGRGIKQI